MANDPNWKLPEVPTFRLTSPDFEDGAPLPEWARSPAIGGEHRSPALEWSGAPEQTLSYALTMYDPDAPTGSGWWHWAVYNIPASVGALPRGAGDPDAGLLPAGAVTVPNERREARYAGAAPPPGHGEHRYVFTLSALAVESLQLPADCTPGFLGFQLREHIVGRAQLTGTCVNPAV